MTKLDRAAVSLLLGAVLSGPVGCSSGGGSGGGDGGPLRPLPIRADHTTLAASAIPQPILDQARALRMNLQHASVGGNILSGMSALATSDATRYSFPNWVWTHRGNPGWEAKVTGFASFVEANLDAYDVFQVKFCYIDQDAGFAAYRDQMLSLEASHPTKRFIWWTLPLMTSGTDNALRAQFNGQVRDYCAATGRPLFDIAAIESHDEAGNAITEGGNEAMDVAWSSDGGHLNATGSDRVARAMWWMMARLAGWSGR